MKLCNTCGRHARETEQHCPFCARRGVAVPLLVAGALALGGCLDAQAATPTHATPSRAAQVQRDNYPAVPAYGIPVPPRPIVVDAGAPAQHDAGAPQHDAGRPSHPDAGRPARHDAGTARRPAPRPEPPSVVALYGIPPGE